MKRSSNEEGSSLVEIAFAAPIFLALLFGVIEFSIAFYSYNFTAEVAKETARYLSVRGSNSCATNSSLVDCGTTSNAAATAYAQSISMPGINPSLAANVTWPDGNNDPGSRVKVDLSYTFPISVPFWTASQIQMNSTAQMVISN